MWEPLVYMAQAELEKMEPMMPVKRTVTARLTPYT